MTPHRPPAAAGVRRLATVGAASLVLVLVLSALASCSKPQETGRPSTASEGATHGTTASGGAYFGLPNDPSAAIRQAGLPELPSEGDKVHLHAHLQVNINGQDVTVPAGIGIVCDTRCDQPGATMKAISPLHTHTDDGIIHVEAEKADPITLGQLFTEWGVKLDKTCVATYCTDEGHQMLGFLNGQLVPDPASIPITDHATIYVTHTPKGVELKVPHSYDFAAKNL